MGYPYPPSDQERPRPPRDGYITAYQIALKHGEAKKADGTTMTEKEWIAQYGESLEAANTAATAATAAAERAETAADSLPQYVEAAQAAQTGAESARDGAQSAKASAETAKAGAEAAKASAEAAQTAAEASASESAASAAAAEASKNEAEALVGSSGEVIRLKYESAEPKLRTSDGGDAAPDVWRALRVPAGQALLPDVTTGDNGKFLRVVSGSWAAAEISQANGVSF